MASGRWYRGSMTRARLRDAVSIAIAAACIVLGAVSWMNQKPPYTGVSLRLEGQNLVVDAIDPGASEALGLRPGTVILEIDGNEVNGVKRADVIAQGLRGDFSELTITDPKTGAPSPYPLPTLPTPPIGFTYVVGLGLLLGIGYWVRRGQAGEALRPLAIPLAVASATPLILVPSWAPLSIPLLAAAVGLPTLARLVVADGFVERIPARPTRFVAGAVAVLATVGYIVLVVVYYGLAPLGLYLSQVVSPVAVGTAVAITLVPALILVWPYLVTPTTRSPWERMGEPTAMLLAAVTPAIIGFGYLALGLGVSVPLLWLLVVVIAMQTNARVETLRIQRDTVVAATEAERARLAADLHDDALQEMTLLVRRLDDVGDGRAAELARSIADRLREVCGELRLPILDELGAGPALEWLVGRVGETSGSSVQLERADTGRPPADVELAVFRVAQEALANAVTHGAPPISVRYDAAADRAALSITDHGTGLADDAASVAGRSGHYGLLNMRQRAEQIGARIDFRRPPEGGTVIGLEWGLG